MTATATRTPGPTTDVHPVDQVPRFADVGPMIAIGAEYGVTAIYASVIIAGLFMILVASVFSQLLRFFPPLVTGTIILITGVSLTSAAASARRTSRCSSWRS